jgi:hypothetical protein
MEVSPPNGLVAPPPNEVAASAPNVGVRALLTASFLVPPFRLAQPESTTPFLVAQTESAAPFSSVQPESEVPFFLSSP